MRRAFFIGIGLLELAAAGLLLTLGLQLPSTREVESGFGRAERVVDASAAQVSYLRDSLDRVNNPQLGGLREASAGLGNLARGMDAWAEALDPKMIERLRKGTGEFAAFLDERVAPRAKSAGERLKEVSAGFERDSKTLAELIRESPTDFRVAREIHESLGRFGDGLEKMSFLISPERLKSMREGVMGMEKSLDTGADQVDRLSSYTYPVVKFNGLKAEVDEKSFWPEGEKIAEGMRKGAKAMREANKELDAQAANLPHIQKSLDESKATVKKLRDALGHAVKNQDKLDRTLRSLPESIALLAERMPLLTKDLQIVLGETERLGEIAVGLREADKLLRRAEESWPEAQKGLRHSADQLRGLQKKIDQGLENPWSRLQQQQQSLDELSDNLESIHGSMPAASDTTVRAMTALRWLLWVLSAAAALHATYLACSALGIGAGRPALKTS